MSALLSVSKVRFKDNSRRSYAYFDDSGELLASVTQMAGGQPRGRLARAFAAERDYSPSFLHVTAPDGSLIFSIERPPRDRGDGTILPIIRTQDEDFVGRIMPNDRTEGGPGGATRTRQRRWQLVGADGAVLCDVVPNLVSELYGFGFLMGKNRIKYTNASGGLIARSDGRWIEFEREVADDLRMLVIASPVAFDLLDGA
ncbi:hypothetical protein [Actinomadura sp. WAC 06369]|uniref:hypothetical protein n=1 Tax=Actinomadura sp. WAC 06369 TaxID=2203193 RepID=UPI000F7A9D71|nr:hypothetical protein [Actinomadura sp. WAC 06369]RSN60276.1 hypothetical protein DMH08_20950 [Actinomadura sp. WAC 06369]